MTQVVTEKTSGAMQGRRGPTVLSEYIAVGDRAWSKEGNVWIELHAEAAAGQAAALRCRSPRGGADESAMNATLRRGEPSYP